MVVNLALALLFHHFICACLFNLFSILSLTLEHFLCSKLIINQADSIENRVLSDQGLSIFGVIHDHHRLVMAIASPLWLQVTAPVEYSTFLRPFLVCISILDSVEAAVLRIDFGQVEGTREQVVDLALKGRND